MPSNLWSVFLFIAGLSLLAGCSTYRQNIMFKTAEDFAGKEKSQDLLKAEKNYIIQINDYLQLEVFSNKGERIIDPNGELLKSQVVATQTQNVSEPPKYLVDIGGMVNFPMIGLLKLEGLTIRQAEQTLQQEYDKFYKECYVILSFSNKRVILLGAIGGQVIPLTNENVSLVEVLALAKGIGNEGKAHNIRLLRGEDVYILDLSTLDGVKKSNMIVQPGDVVYVEPIRRPFIEGFRDFSPIASLFLSLGTLILVIVNLNNPN